MLLSIRHPLGDKVVLVEQDDPDTSGAWRQAIHRLSGSLGASLVGHHHLPLGVPAADVCRATPRVQATWAWVWPSANSAPASVSCWGLRTPWAMTMVSTALAAAARLSDSAGASSIGSINADGCWPGEGSFRAGYEALVA